MLDIINNFIIKIKLTLEIGSGKDKANYKTPKRSNDKYSQLTDARMYTTNTILRLIREQKYNNMNAEKLEITYKINNNPSTITYNMEVLLTNIKLLESNIDEYCLYLMGNERDIDNPIISYNNNYDNVNFKIKQVSDNVTQLLFKIPSYRKRNNFINSLKIQITMKAKKRKNTSPIIIILKNYASDIQRLEIKVNNISGKSLNKYRFSENSLAEETIISPITGKITLSSQKDYCMDDIFKII